MYPDARGDVRARAYARFWSQVFRCGLLPSRWVTLEVPGRSSGRLTRFPLGICRWAGEEYLVAMLGECNWSRNVRANDGRAVLWRRRPRAVRLEQVPVAERAAIVKAYLEQVPGGRPHIPVPPQAPVEQFAPVVAAVPVFRIRDGW